jgi:hypothetical protein
MPVEGKLYVRELRDMYKAGGEEAIKAFYPATDSFLLILTDGSGFPAYVSWTPNNEETGVFEITSNTPTEEQKSAPTTSTPRSKPPSDSPFDSGSVVVPLLGEAGGEKDIVSVGRGGFNDIKLTSLSVSAMQSSFIRAPDGSWGLMDRNSRNGTYIDGIRLDTNKLYPTLSSGREIAFADIRCIFLDTEGVLDVCKA